MGRANVKYGDKWACLSSIVESLITPFMSLDDYEKWRKEEYGNAGYAPMKERNTIDIAEAVHTMRMNHERDEVLKALVDCGLSESEALKLIDENDDKYYRPKLEGENYICPNCGRIVSKGQMRCSNDDCWIKFVW